ncbi:MAG: 16S rRNA (cytidine(1402)-2'-O)-methyltransferase [Patescibacteria group bacterium]|nr:16S rRNA (cytidine(1402)-2'-O)-methyltransferase [Patescibacteria group bacterium]
MLFVVATPIGHLDDITLRALKTLREVDLILAEDTRVTQKLLKHFEISTPVKSLHHHSSPEKIRWVVEELKTKKAMALVTDAGTPGIADPAGHLVEAVYQAGLSVVPIPGSSALTTLLSVSGINTDQFIFAGFLPKKKGRQTFFAKFKDIHMPIVIFESPMRVVKTLEDIKAAWGSREIVIGRELTKLHEEVLRCDTNTAIKYFTDKKPKGEFVLIVR